MTTQTLLAPAKLNLFLAITGRRADGFHDLVSVVAPISLSDTVTVAPAAAGEFRLTCSDPEVPVDETNLVLKAARAFAARTKWQGGAAFHIDKRIPMGAGLGGGSSDGVAALKGLNALAGGLLGHEALLELAATLGSDCPLFLYDAPVVMRGRGERVAPLPKSAVNRLRGRRVLVFKPAFGISTVWAYRRLAELAAAERSPAAAARPAPGGTPGAGAYLASADAEARLERWFGDPAAPAEALLFNSLERPAFEKHLALPTLLEILRQEFQLAPRMTGSGSACFALLDDTVSAEAIGAAVRRNWGDSAVVLDARIA